MLPPTSCFIGTQPYTYNDYLKKGLVFVQCLWGQWLYGLAILHYLKVKMIKYVSLLEVQGKHCGCLTGKEYSVN